MGDRGNIFIVQHDGSEGPKGGIFFYSHWSGYRLPQILQAALIRGESRWDDEPYLARIIFSEMTRSEKPDDTTGYGITTYLTDNEYPILVVDVEKQKVGVAPESPKPHEKIERETSFAEFVKLDKKGLQLFVRGKADEDD